VPTTPSSNYYRGHSPVCSVQDLSGQFVEQDATYTSEVAGLWRLIEMVEAREAQSKAIVENVKQEWVIINDRVAAGVSRRSVG